jgi:hypothetical protein
MPGTSRVIAPFGADLVMVVTALDLADTRAIAARSRSARTRSAGGKGSERGSLVSCIGSLDSDRDDVHGCRPR